MSNTPTKTKAVERTKDELVTSRLGEDGFYHFYYGDLDVTSEWMWFFSELTSEQEKNCTKLFVKWYQKHHD